MFQRTHSWRRRRRNLLSIDIKLSYQKLNIAWVNQSMAGCQKSYSHLSWPPYVTFRIWHIYIQSNNYTKEEQKSPPPSTAKANIKKLHRFQLVYSWFPRDRFPAGDKKNPSNYVCTMGFRKNLSGRRRHYVIALAVLSLSRKHVDGWVTIISVVCNRNGE